MTPSPPNDPWRITDGVVHIRPPHPGDSATLLAGRDAVWMRWMGPGVPDPQPTACIVLGSDIIGWADYAQGAEWLAPDEVNVGYSVFASDRRRGYAARAVMLLVHRMALEGTYRTASVMIDHGNVASIGVARRARFGGRREYESTSYLCRPVPPLTYTDGVVTIRRQDPADTDMVLRATDEQQIRWLWRPGARERWEAMTPAEQRAHIERGLRASRDAFGSGPKWTFAVDTEAQRAVGYIDFDLAPPMAPAGEANIAYACHPDYRGKGYTRRALRLVLRFIAMHTGTRLAHLLIEQGNVASLRVARTITTREPEATPDEQGRPSFRFVVDVDGFAGRGANPRDDAGASKARGR